MEHGCHMPCQGEKQPNYRIGLLDASRILLTLALIGLYWWGVVPLIAGFELPGLIAALLLGYPIYRDAVEAVMKLRMTMGLSMTIAVIAALSLGEAFTALVIIFFVLLAEELEKFTIFRGRSSIRSLLDLLPEIAFVKRDGKVLDVQLSEVAIGDTVVVKPGGRLVVDGVVLKGRSFVDEATITGESLPVEKSAGSKVFAGSVNHGSVLEVRAESVGQETVFGKVIAAVSQAENNRGSVQRLGDRLAAWLVYCSLAMALVTWYVTGDTRQTISVVIVSGACGIAAGTPLAIYGAIGRAARMGAIVKGGVFIEQLASIDTIVFDKTGTLTCGTPKVVQVRAANGSSEQKLLEIAVSAEYLSEHPISKAVRAYAAEHGVARLPTDEVRFVPGKGIICRLNGQTALVGNRSLLALEGASVPEQLLEEGLSEVHVALDGKYLGVLQVADEVRKEAFEALQELRLMNIHTLILSGDNQSSVRRAAEQLDFKEFSSNMTPDEKHARVVELKGQGRKVAMIGDGVNDAPALTAANVGIAMGSGADVALESADIMLIGNNLMRLVETVKVARQCRRIILANFIGTVLVDVVGMGLAFAGLMSPIVAALVHSGSEVIFLLNSVRLLPFFQWRQDKTEKDEKK